MKLRAAANLATSLDTLVQIVDISFNKEDFIYAKEYENGENQENIKTRWNQP